VSNFRLTKFSSLPDLVPLPSSPKPMASSIDVSSQLSQASALLTRLFPLEAVLDSALVAQCQAKIKQGSVGGSAEDATSPRKSDIFDALHNEAMSMVLPLPF